MSVPLAVSPAPGVRTRVLIADSVFEDATVTLTEAAVIYIEFDAADLESVTLDLRPFRP